MTQHDLAWLNLSLPPLPSPHLNQHQRNGQAVGRGVRRQDRPVQHSDDGGGGGGAEGAKTRARGPRSRRQHDHYRMEGAVFVHLQGWCFWALF